MRQEWRGLCGSKDPTRAGETAHLRSYGWLSVKRLDNGRGGCTAQEQWLVVDQMTRQGRGRLYSSGAMVYCGSKDPTRAGEAAQLWSHGWLWVKRPDNGGGRLHSSRAMVGCGSKDPTMAGRRPSRCWCFHQYQALSPIHTLLFFFLEGVGGFFITKRWSSTSRNKS